MGMVLPQLLWDNALRKSGFTLSYSGTPVVGFEYGNAIDWRDFSQFRPQAVGTATNFDCLVNADTTISALAAWFTAVAGSIPALNGVQLQYESAPSTFTNIGSLLIPNAAGTIQWVSFSPITVLSGRKIRFVCYNADSIISIRQLCVGVPMSPPTGQWSGVNPPTLQQGVVVDNQIAVNGSILGRNIRRTVRTGQLDFNLLDAAWVRSTWNPFAIHMTRWACFYRWDPMGHPDEVALAAAESIDPPKNDRPVPKMRVTMPLRLLAD